MKKKISREAGKINGCLLKILELYLCETRNFWCIKNGSVNTLRLNKDEMYYMNFITETFHVVPEILERMENFENDDYVRSQVKYFISKIRILENMGDYGQNRVLRHYSTFLEKSSESVGKLEEIIKT